MKKKLLFLSLLIMFCLQGFAQAEAYPVQDINQCNSEVFDLTVQTPITLGNQSPANYSVTYHLTWQDAENNMNAIANPTAFMMTGNDPEQALYIRVTNLSTGDFDTTSFVVGHWGGPQVPDFPDVMVCDSYILPALEVGNYYSGPYGTGTILPAGTAITTTAMIYVYATNGVMCTSQSNFYVTVNGSQGMQMDPITECNTDGTGFAFFDLEFTMYIMSMTYPDAEVLLYSSMEDAQAGVNPILNVANYVNTTPWQQTLYVGAQTNACNWITMIPLVVIECTDITMSGHVAYDADGNGCDASDAPAEGILISYTSGNDYNYAYTDAEGNYTFYNVPNGPVNVIVNTSYPALVTATPENHALTINEENVENVDFCLTPPAPVNDVAVYLYPTSAAQPGFPASYALVINNFGNTTANGTITLEFNDTQLDFTQSWPAMSQSGNTLTASYTNLQPYGYQVIYLEFLVAQPGIVDLGDVITFTSNINLNAGTDNYMYNNTYVLDQVSVNSFDPNDINVREGVEITEAQADGYLHYIIRFQNTGNANAQFINVLTTLDDNLDWETFMPISASHEFQANRNGNNVTFNFDDIQLPGEQVNEQESHGFVIYRIKPKTTVEVGDSMSGQANIYFDFNAPIITNTITTTIVPPAGVNDLSAKGFVMYPNPASSKITLQMTAEANNASVKIIDVLGKTVGQSTFTGTQSDIDISMLNSGVYFVTVNADGKMSTQKLVVN